MQAHGEGGDSHSGVMLIGKVAGQAPWVTEQKSQSWEHQWRLLDASKT